MLPFCVRLLCKQNLWATQITEVKHTTTYDIVFILTLSNFVKERKGTIKNYEIKIHTFWGGHEYTLCAASAKCDYYEEADERDEREGREGTSVLANLVQVLQNYLGFILEIRSEIQILATYDGMRRAEACWR